MKKSLLLFSLAMASPAMTMSAVEASLDWYKQFGGEKQASINQVAPVTGSTDLYVLCDAQYPTAKLVWGSEELNTSDFTYDESANVKTPYTVTLARITDNGDLVWNISNTYGDVQISNGTFLAPTSDGGVVMAFGARNYDKNSTSPFVFKIKGTNGTEYQAPYICPENVNAKVVVIVKVNDKGEIVWVHQIDGDTTYNNVTEPVAMTSVAVDADDNVYVAGYHVTEMTVAPLSGGEKKIASVNLPDNWDGKGSYGDAYIVKLDKDGKCVGQLTPDVSAAYASIDQITGLTYANGELYFTGMVTGATAAYNLGGKQVSPANELATLYVGKLDTDLNVTWLTTVETVGNSAGKAVLQNRGLVLNGEYVVASGALNGGMKAGAITIDSKAAQLHGYNVALNATTGAVEAMVMNPNAVISSDFLAITDGTETTTYGYQMAGAGVTASNYLMTFDNATGELKNSIELCTANITYGGYFAAPGTLYTLPRTNATLTIMGTDAGKSLGSFDSWLVKYNLTDMTGVEEIAVDNTSYAGAAEYYDLTGRRILNPANGLYIVRRGNIVTKELIK